MYVACLKINYCLSSYPDEDGIRELLDNIPEVAKEFDVISKIGEGKSDTVYFLFS